MFRGTKNVPNYDIPLQETGAQSNAFTSEDLTVYFETVPASFLDRALYLEAERLAFLPTALDQEKFDTEREVVKNERRQSVDNVPYGLAEEAILANVFPKGHPYSWSVIGSMKDLDAASLKDLRQVLRRVLPPGQRRALPGGRLRPGRGQGVDRQVFRADPRRQADQAGRGADARRCRKSTARAWSTRSASRGSTGPGRPSPTTTPTPRALHLLASVLTDGEASRLHRALVKDARVANDVDADSDTKEVAGLFTDRRDRRRGEDARGVSKAASTPSFADLSPSPPTQAELTRALAKFERQTYTALTSPLGRAIMLASDFVEKGDPAYYRTRLRPLLQGHARRPRPGRRDVPRGPRRSSSTIVPAEARRAQERGRPGRPACPTLDGDRARRAAEDPGRPRAGRAPRPVRPRPAGRPRDTSARRSRTASNSGSSPGRPCRSSRPGCSIPVGTADDPAGKSGLANLTATLLDKGTKTKTDNELAEELEALGVSLSAGASVDSTDGRLLGPRPEPRPRRSSLLGQILTAPRFDPEDFDRERKLELDALLQGPDSPTWIAAAGLPVAALRAGSSLRQAGRRAIDATVKAITLDDVRAFHARYAANRSTLIVVGDVDPEALAATLESTLGVWKTTGPDAARPTGVRGQGRARRGLPGRQAGGRPERHRRSAGAGSTARTRRYFATLIGNHVVGDDFLSRLNANLREKNGYSYGCGSSVQLPEDRQRSGRSAPRSGPTSPPRPSRRSSANSTPWRRTIPSTTEEIATARDAEARTFPESFEDPERASPESSPGSPSLRPPGRLSGNLPRQAQGDARRPGPAGRWSRSSRQASGPSSSSATGPRSSPSSRPSASRRSGSSTRMGM